MSLTAAHIPHILIRVFPLSPSAYVIYVKHSDLYSFTYSSTLQHQAPDSQRSHHKCQNPARSPGHDIQQGKDVIGPVWLSASSQGPAATSHPTGPQLEAPEQKTMFNISMKVK